MSSPETFTERRIHDVPRRRAHQGSEQAPGAVELRFAVPQTWAEPSAPTAPPPPPPSTVAGPERLGLYGPDHPDLGVLTVRPVAQRAAIGLSRGRHPKSPPSLDPNEDVVASVSGSASTLLIVADGHHGADAAVTAVQCVLDGAGTDPPPVAETDARTLVTWLWSAGEAAWHRTREAGRPRNESRTTLTLALVDDTEVRWASIGDSHCFVVEDTGAQWLTTSRALYLGGHHSLPEVAGRASTGSRALVPGNWVVLATDGVVDYLGESLSAVAGTLAGIAQPVPAARRLMGLAADGGAGDHQGVALYRAE